MEGTRWNDSHHAAGASTLGPDQSRDETGRRLAKRDDARAIATYRAEGRSPREIREMVGLTA